MKKEFGKWLMDIAKYLATAVLLTSFFNDLKEEWVMYATVTAAIIITLGWGLWFIRDKKKGE